MLSDSQASTLRRETSHMWSVWKTLFRSLQYEETREAARKRSRDLPVQIVFTQLRAQARSAESSALHARTRAAISGELQGTFRLNLIV